MKITIDISDNEYSLITTHVANHTMLSDQEQKTGRASCRLLDLEHDFGRYEWLVKRMCQGVQ